MQTLNMLQRQDKNRTRQVTKLSLRAGVQIKVNRYVLPETTSSCILESNSLKGILRHLPFLDVFQCILTKKLYHWMWFRKNIGRNMVQSQCNLWQELYTCKVHIHFKETA